uniref:Uncharacterized protein n=1 Tax=Anolis carolinensis TaxID=28377 RepID=A0A803SXA4_ANOCA
MELEESLGEKSGEEAKGYRGRLFLLVLRKMNEDAQMRATINQKPIETRGQECLKELELLRAKLIECGWKDQLKAHCKGHRQKINSEGGIKFFFSKS